jgi:hypothetical protein
MGLRLWLQPRLGCASGLGNTPSRGLVHQRGGGGRHEGRSKGRGVGVEGVALPVLKVGGEAGWWGHEWGMDRRTTLAMAHDDVWVVGTEWLLPHVGAAVVADEFVLTVLTKAALMSQDWDSGSCGGVMGGGGGCFC